MEVGGRSVAVEDWRIGELSVGVSRIACGAEVEDGTGKFWTMYANQMTIPQRTISPQPKPPRRNLSKVEKNRLLESIVRWILIHNAEGASHFRKQDDSQCRFVHIGR